MSIQQLRRRVNRLKSPGQNDSIRDHWLRRLDQRMSLLVYFLKAIPEPLQERVMEVFEPHLDTLMQPWLAVTPTAPLVCRWIEVLDVPGGRIPNPMPASLVELFLAHPSADLLWWDCEQCGLFIPIVANQPVVKECLVCSGTIGWQAFRNKHGYFLPSLAERLPSVEQLLEGKQ
jgi:hypothetical protein